MSTAVMGKSWKYQSQVLDGWLRHGSIMTLTPRGDVIRNAELPKNANSTGPSRGCDLSACNSIILLWLDVICQTFSPVSISVISNCPKLKCAAWMNAAFRLLAWGISPRRNHSRHQELRVLGSWTQRRRVARFGGVPVSAFRCSIEAALLHEWVWTKWIV